MSNWNLSFLFIKTNILLEMMNNKNCNNTVKCEKSYEGQYPALESFASTRRGQVAGIKPNDASSNDIKKTMTFRDAVAR